MFGNAATCLTRINCIISIRWTWIVPVWSLWPACSFTVF